MKKTFNLFASILTAFTILSLTQNVSAQYMYNYSSNTFQKGSFMTRFFNIVVLQEVYF